MAAGLFIIRKC